MRQRAVEIFQHAFCVGVFRVLLQLRGKAGAHAAGHPALTHPAAQIYGVRRQQLFHILQQHIEIVRVPAEPRRTEQCHLFAAAQRQKPGHVLCACALVCPESGEYHVRVKSLRRGRAAVNAALRRQRGGNGVRHGLGIARFTACHDGICHKNQTVLSWCVPVRAHPRPHRGWPPLLLRRPSHRRLLLLCTPSPRFATVFRCFFVDKCHGI